MIREACLPRIFEELRIRKVKRVRIVIGILSTMQHGCPGLDRGLY